MTQTRRKRVIVGMSGGVDSSVSALLLHRHGYDVSGLFMKNWEDENPDGPCPAAEDAKDALQVCERIGISLDAVNFARQYWERVFQYFLDEYRCGRTPNPDVLCNKEIKFTAFLEYALQQGAEAIATGHYARVSEENGCFKLYKGCDGNKDQSYFLYALGQEQLARVIFPLGELNKTEVRAMARAAGLDNHAKKDSTGICFIGERKFKRFLNQYLPAQPGETQTPDGEVVGTHDGLMFHTLGQRKGLGIGGRRDDSGEPWYVVDKDLERNVLVVAQGHDHPLLFSDSLSVSSLHWISEKRPPFPYRCKAKVRYRQPDQSCTITAIDDKRYRVTFDDPQRAVTPGQSVVFYQDEECLGGGIIEEIENAGQNTCSPQLLEYAQL